MAGGFRRLRRFASCGGGVGSVLVVALPVGAVFLIEIDKLFEEGVTLAVGARGGFE